MYEGDEHRHKRPRTENYYKPPPLRLVVVRSKAFSDLDKNVAILEPYAKTLLCRDRGFDVRLRFPELQVSKSHAFLYFDFADMNWSIVDAGSTHGTFVRSDAGDEPWERLSPSKRASAHPRRLNHLE